MKLDDAIFNWLQIKLVTEARPDDHAAMETLAFFDQILQEDHQVSLVRVSGSDDTMYFVQYDTPGKSRKQMIDKEAAERLLRDIESEPKYTQ